MKIGKINIDKGILLAPMEGVTDLPFRIICKLLGADIVYTEFIASEALIRNIKSSVSKLTIVEAERPVAVQIFGSNINSMIQSAKIVEESGADILDINYGCWVKKVVNNDAGAALLKNPAKMAEMTKAVVDSVSIPVTVKTRLGWDKKSIQIIEIAKMLEQTGIQALTLHCRTREQGMKETADWSWINALKSELSLPIILNGDVKTPQDAERAFDETGCDAVMIGRAAIGNPFIFSRTKEYLHSGNLIEETKPDERISVCLEHLRLNIEYKGFPRGLYEFRKHYAGYLKGLRNNSNTRQKLVIMESVDEVENCLNEYLLEIKNDYLP
ncbi:MAG: tRNA dihydrouridine synthase DusB [Bacteroidota bacterium]